MNIKEAKEEIKRTLRAYLTIPEDCPCRIPKNKQRPILLIGPPGIGKTAIMEQIASESGIGLVSYTMTHHTRQSAIGLPFIRQEEFQGTACSVTEYTMSEIIASIYQYMKKTGKTRGILFIDEINCVSETLVPVMLQFLQEKTFGNHAVPEGWMIAAAGNPPEYNRSVREFDTVTLDRVKYMSVEADYAVWKEYAVRKGLHPAILSYLSLHPDRFYLTGEDRDPNAFVTARGWEDLSCMLLALEHLEETVSESLFSQYLHHAETARDFSLFYELFCHHRAAFRIPEYLEGSLSEEENGRLFSRLKEAPADELFAVSSLVSNHLLFLLEQFHRDQDRLKRLSELLEPLYEQRMTVPEMETSISHLEEALRIRREKGLLSIPESEKETELLTFLKKGILRLKAQQLTSFQDAKPALKEYAELPQKALEAQAQKLLSELKRGYRLLEAALPDETAVLCLTTDLSKNAMAAEFLTCYSCHAYESWCSRLLLSSREASLRDSIQKLITTPEEPLPR
ncbi:MAG: AAA family ATPase [Candidatus Limivivens sp.]|nr:AAA family ATPase [Candidatus Limivivens sp.]